jgi:hypothetical protein
MATKENSLLARIPQPEIVDAFMKELQHPMLDVMQYLRKLILS